MIHEFNWDFLSFAALFIGWSNLITCILTIVGCFFGIMFFSFDTCENVKFVIEVIAGEASNDCSFNRKCKKS